jgi:hypothetical protein
MTPRRRVVFLAAALALGGCIDYLPPGEHGVLRYFGEVRGDAPLPLLPPITDRDGNAYVIYGAPDQTTELDVFAGSANGGWFAGCDVLRNQVVNLGARMWVGAARSRAWYWAGEGLVQMSGRTGSCRIVLPNDPATNVRLAFLGVIPRIYETPSRTFVQALMRGGNDIVHVTIDLDRDDYGEVRPFEPSDAADVRVLGTGADPQRNIGYMLVSYEQGGVRRVDAIHLDRNNREIARARVNMPGELAAEFGHGAVHGNLQSVDGALVAGYLENGDIVLFDREGGEVRSVPGMSARGVHRWEGQVYVVGESGGQPHIATINRSGDFFGPTTLWDASLRTAGRLEGTVRVLDDRREPRRVIGWENPTSAMGEFPFLQPWSPHPYAEGTTAWLVAGPSFDVAGIRRTSVAYGPVGISYP